MSTVKKPETPVVNQPAVEKETSEAEKIWNEIKDLPIEMFALPSQFVWQHVEPFPFHTDPNRLLLQTRSTATLPSLEAAVDAEVRKNTALAEKFVAIGRKDIPVVKKYNIELTDRFVMVSRAASALVLPAKKR